MPKVEAYTSADAAAHMPAEKAQLVGVMDALAFIVLIFGMPWNKKRKKS